MVVFWGETTCRDGSSCFDDTYRRIILPSEWYNKSYHINLGFGTETIRELVDLIQKLNGFSEYLHWDTTKPD